MQPVAKDLDQEQDNLPPPVILRNWRKAGRSLKGNAFGHPRFPDGEPIVTSDVVYMTRTVAQTLNTLYRLERPA